MEVKEYKRRGCLIAFLFFAVIAVIIFIVIHNKQKERNPNNNDEPGFFERKANLDDLEIISDDLNITSLGVEFIIKPKLDIQNLKICFEFMKKNVTLQQVEKTIGNVKEDNLYSLTLSLVDLNWEVIKNINDVDIKYYVSGGTVQIIG
ncbi:MAG: hypothetical protein HFJ22_07215 [Clostridia bacterium]|jgi:hypothetical protein|nr:hypothetical protein [Clostridia bacterium]